MSWHYLQEQEAACWDRDSLDGAPSALLSLIPTAAKCCSPDKETDYSTGSQSGTTLGRSMANHGEGTSTSSLEGFRARTSQRPEAVKESAGFGAGCGPRWRGSFVKYDHDMCSWKTHQCSLFEGLESFSEIWPRWGLMLDGECWELVPAVPGTKGGGSGSWPTPTARDYKGYSTRNRWTVPNVLKQLFPKTSGAPHPRFIESLMGWPIGWTALEPLETDKFQQWLDLHGAF